MQNPWRWKWMHSGCNLDMEPIAFVEAWDVGMVLGGAGGKERPKEHSQQVVQQGRWHCHLLHLRLIGKEVNLKLGTIISCIDCQNHFLIGFYLQLSSQPFILEKSHLPKLIQKKNFFKTGQKKSKKTLKWFLKPCLSKRFRAHKGLREILSMYHSEDKFYT